MRLWLLLGASVVVLGGGAWLVFGFSPERPAAPAAAPLRAEAWPDTVRQVVRQELGPESQAKPDAGSGNLTIQGTVLGPMGLVAGARVLATVAVEGETLSTVPCGALQERTLLQCAWSMMGVRLGKLVEERQGEALERAETVTQADGSFVLSGLEPGSYALWVEGAEGIGFRPDVSAGAESVVLRMGPGVRLSGTVTDDAKAPVPGALITVIFSAHSRFFETVTDAQGRFALPPVPGGGQVIVIRKEGLMTLVDSMGEHHPRVNRTFALSRPLRITGRVLLSDAPVAGVQVEARDTFNVPAGTVTTDSEGRFAFEELSPIDLKVAARHEGAAASAKVEWKKVTGEPEVTLQLRPTFVLEGVVRDEGGQPVVGAELSMHWVEEEEPPEDSLSETWAKTDAEGHYRLGPAPPGRYLFEVSHGRFQKIEEGERFFGAGESQRDFVLKAAFLVEGVLVTSDGQPVPEEYLSLSSADPEGPSSQGVEYTDEEGHFSIAVPQPGDYRLTASGDRIRPLEVPVTAPATGLRIVAEPLLSLEGEVVDDAGGPLYAVMMSLWREGVEHAKNRPLGRADTDKEGRFSMHISEPGRYELVAVMAWQDTLRVASQIVEVSGKQSSRVRVRLPAGRRLSVVVVDWYGKPVPGALMQLLPSPRYTEQTRCCNADYHPKTDAEGRVVIAEATGEQVELCFKKDNYVAVGSTSAQPRCTRVKNDGQEQRIILGREVFVTGRLVRADGSPVQHFIVNGEEKRRPDGEFSIRVLQPGVEKITLSAPGGYTVQRTSPVFADGEVLQDLGSIVLAP
jgi:hypothetical protein